MKIDRMFFQRFEDTVRANDIVASAIESGQWDRVIDYVNRELFNKPQEFYTLDKLRKAAAVDRRLTLREILEKIFGPYRASSQRMNCLKKNSQSSSLTTSRMRQNRYRPSRHTSRLISRAIRCGISSKAGNLPHWRRIPSFQPATSRRCRRNTASLSLNTSRIMFP